MAPSRTDRLWDQGEDEAVEVNQRALIDKILARYSGENTIFRELLQNADDAGAQHVQIKYYTEAGIKQLETEGSTDAKTYHVDDSGKKVLDLPNLKTALMSRYVVSNDGIPFRPQDWQRLKKIAEGNPDEEKIGAFGVGFYSLWSVCENPLVESGDRWMGFYWKDGKDQLLARSGALPSPSTSAAPTLSGNPWTTFTMDLRSPTVFEAPMDFARFLVTSLTFMRSMRQIDMLVDDTVVLSITKAKGAGQIINTRKLGLRGQSPGGVMTVEALEATGVVISAKVMRYLAASGFTPPPLPPAAAVATQAASSFASMLSSALWSRPKPVAAPTPPPPPPKPKRDETHFTERYMQLKIFQAGVNINVSRDFGKELERATKKAPPKKTSLSLIFSTGKAVLASPAEGGNDEDGGEDGVFAGLSPRADGETTGRIFIGQATGQTTGIGGHIAARFIPTVERESIDLVDRHVSHWNKELLYIGGYVARAVYEIELQDCKDTPATDDSERKAVQDRAAHALQFFTYHNSTPSPVVSRDMELAFFASSIKRDSFPIMSNLGVRQASEVRLPHPILSAFLQGMPTVLPDTLSTSSRMVARLQERGLLREPSMEDVVKELSARPLTELEMVDCLKWWLSLSGMKEYSSSLRGRLIEAAIFTIKEDDSEKVVPLSMIKTFINPRTSSIPTDVPLPSHTLPYAISKQLSVEKLYPVFGWSELSLPDYVTFLCNPPLSGSSEANPDTDIRVSPIFAERFFGILARAWPQLSAASTAAICGTLSQVQCIPTKAGMRKPSEAYFDSVKLFPDLAIIALPKGTIIKGPLDKVFATLGVRRTVDLQLVFSRLVGGGEWSVSDLVKYLVSVRETLTSEELGKLRKTAAFPLEKKVEGRSAIRPDGTSPKVERRMPSQLYEPTESLRSLGLPLLDWGDAKWKPTSEEAKLLFSFGLKRQPPIEELLSVAASEGVERQAALRYLLANLDTQYAGFRAVAHSTIAFLPAVKPDGTTFLAKPGEVFINLDSQILGFAVVQELLLDNASAAKLGVSSNPPFPLLAKTLCQKPPATRERAIKVFEYMAAHVGVASDQDLGLLRTSKFIPVPSQTSPGSVAHARPADVYFASSDSAQTLYQSFFTYVDMGERANNFLRACGVKSEPSIHEVTTLIVKDPQRFLDLAGSPERYQNQLRQVAANLPSLSYSTRMSMKSAPFLLASQLVPKAGSSKRRSTDKSPETTDMDEMVHVWRLAKANEIAIIDDTNPYHLFGTAILAAPQETLLEEFYEQLGSRSLSTLIQEEYKVDGPSSNTTSLAVNLKKLVLERLALFLAEPRRKPSDISLEWLKKDGNFDVVQVRGLKVKRTYRYAGAERSDIQPVSAAAIRDKRKTVTLSISGSLEPDYYEVASALVKVLFKHSRPDEPLLLMTILSTPLQALRRRGEIKPKHLLSHSLMLTGYNVDRILNQQKAERLAVQAQLSRERELQVAPSMPSAGVDDGRSQTEMTPVLAPTETRDAGSTVTKKGSFMDKFKRRSSQSSGVAGPNLPHLPQGITSAIGSAFNSRPSAGGLGGLGGTPRPQSHGPQSFSAKQPTSAEDIKRTAQRAVAASRPELGNSIVDKQSVVRNVKESSDAYCDASGIDAALSFAENLPSGLKLFIPQDVTDRAGFVSSCRDLCDRFASAIVQPIGVVFKLDPASLHIFIDHEGPLIAFNRGGSVFLNARYYKSWHDEQVMSGQRGEAFVSWYFSVAHELAHNLESQHNSTHEFYFSSISETYLVPFMRLLQETGTV